MSTFWAVFSAIVLAEVCKEIYERYIKKHVKTSFDKVDEHGRKMIKLGE